MAEEQQDIVTPVLSDFNTKLGDMEEKQKLSKERVLLIGQNLVELREEFETEKNLMKADIEDMKESIEKIKKTLIRVSEEIEKRARRNELEILQNQMRMFSPLEVARIEDVKNMLKKR